MLSKYYAPPIEFLGQYSTGVDSAAYIAQVYSIIKTNKLKTCPFQRLSDNYT